MCRIVLITAVFCLIACPRGETVGAEPLLPPGDETPVLRLETGGPRSYISGLAFGPDGQQLYAVGWDKAVQVWNRNQDGQYHFNPGAALRVPVGPGLAGGLNHLAQSADGKWLAVAGQGYARDTAGQRHLGWILPASVLGSDAKLDEGLIYVFHVPTRTARLLRGHRGPVQSLAFVRNSPSDPPELVSAAEERSDDRQEIRPRLCLWNVQQGTEIASLSAVPAKGARNWIALPSLQGWRPSLTAWSTGPEPRQTRVAIAWGDDEFRVWDAQTGQVAPAAMNPNTALLLPLPGTSERLLVGSHAEIGQWSIPEFAGGQLGALNKGRHFQIARIDSVNGKAQQLPTAAAFVPSAGGKPPHVALVVTHYMSADQAEYRLVLATASAPINTVRELRLPWSRTVRLPALAASRDGRLLALAGNDDNAISVFAVDELLAGKLAPLQTLRSVGLRVRHAAFVRNDGRWGVMLSESPRGAPKRAATGDVVLDIGRRQVVPMNDSWKSATIPAAGWTLERKSPHTLLVREGGNPGVEITLEDDYLISSEAICPATPDRPHPLVAVASHLRGQPRLQIFNARTGEPLRWCTGHTERIRSLSFSEDGRMLLSAADDQTTSVWSLTDLAERTIGKRGRIPGLVVGDLKDRVFVQTAAMNSPLKPGDEIVAVVREAETIPLQRAKDFYQFVLERPPGENLPVQVRRNDLVTTVQLPIGQAIDEARPLFSLFIVPADGQRNWGWIGWHWLGNFDSSDEDVERLLGWHFNTGELERPARFAEIGEYRDGFYRRDLLQSLLDEQKLVLPVVEDAPQMSLWIRQPDGTPVPVDFDERAHLRSTDVQAVVEVSGISPRRIQKLELTLDEGQKLPLEQVSPREWIVDLSKIELTRGSHRLATTLTTPDREVTSIDRLQYEPAGPRIRLTPPEKEIAAAEWNLKAVVSPATEPIQVELQLQRAGQEKLEKLRMWQTDSELQIEESIPLEPGDNRLILQAWNSTAPDEYREAESARSVVNVRRATPPQAPRIEVTKVFFTPDAGEAALLLPDEGIYRSVWPRVRVVGKITAEDKLTRATAHLAEKQRDLTGFRADELKEFAFDESFSLAPGRQTVLIAAAVGDQTDERRLVFSFEPPPPRVGAVKVSPAEKKPLPPGVAAGPNVFYAGYHARETVVAATIEGSLDYPYQATLWIDDRPVPAESIKIDRTAADRHQLQASIVLPEGKSRVSVRVANEWAAEPVSSAVELDFRRPPEIVEVKAAARLVAEPLNLTCLIRSALPVRVATVQIDSSEVPRTYACQQVPGEADLWSLTVEKLGLEIGNHTLKIAATNAEGTTLVPWVHQVTVEKPADKPPVLTILSPEVSGVGGNLLTNAITTSSPETELLFSVKSASEIDVRMHVSVRREAGRDEYVLSERKIPDVSRDGTPTAINIELAEGTNLITLSVTNEGGKAEQSLLVSYIPTPVSVEIASIGGLRPRLRNTGEAWFDQPVPSSRVLLQGKVVIRSRSSEIQPLAARIWVNNYKLPTAEVVMESPTTGSFQSELVLNRPHGNHIQVEVFHIDGHVATELGAMNTVEIDCESPERGQELYLLLLGSGNGPELKARARELLRAETLTTQAATQEVWKSADFARIHVHEAIDVPPAVVQNQLRVLVGKMLANLRGGTTRGGPRSIVMIYYQGEIVLTQDDFVLGTPGAEGRSVRNLTGRMLQSQLMRTYGAHLILLDLQRNRQGLAASDVWPKAPHLGLMIANWKGEGEQPEGVRLISALERYLPQSKVVRELAQKINASYQQAAVTYPDQVEAVERLENLYELRLGIVDDGT